MFEIKRNGNATMHQRRILNNIDAYLKSHPVAKRIVVKPVDYQHLFALVPEDLQKPGLEIGYQGRLVTCR